MSKQSNRRLAKEFKLIQENPVPYISAHPNDSNILEWHYVLTGPPDTPYAGGQYHGTLTFASDYPFKPPSIRMITPSGRFKTNTRLCLLMLDFHPDTWNPAWLVLTILTGLLSFMTGSEGTTGSITTSTEEKVRLAGESKAWNVARNERFKREFPTLYESNQVAIEAEKETEKKAQKKTERETETERAEEPREVDAEDQARLATLTESHRGSWEWGVFMVALIGIGLMWIR